jgi:hypothetical protein
VFDPPAWKNSIKEGILVSYKKKKVKIFLSTAVAQCL